jgi:putative protease
LSAKRKKIPELLAPAGGRKALEAAIAAGADAVYLGGRHFGARGMAENFDFQGLKSAVSYAHLRERKVYVTVNTLIHDRELTGLALYLLQLYEIGVDAVLVQDVGAAALVGRLLPDLDVHASTQMTIHNSPGIKWASSLGMKRVVLAREMNLREVKEMAKNAKATGGIGLEVFVHGALCYSVSGQCLLSSVIGGRSGNRGLCAQPCRKPYILQKGGTDAFGRPEGITTVPLRERFLLSTKDLCTYPELDKIVSSPIDSLKIEGRMKSPEYVAVVTDIYRRALDAIANGDWRPSCDDMRDLAAAFNREFTAGHLLGSSEIMGREMSDKRGIEVGAVASYDIKLNWAAIRLRGDLCPEIGDGVVIISPGQETGLVVRHCRMKDGLFRLKTAERVRPGARVYITFVASLAKKAETIMKKGGPKIPITLDFALKDDVPQIKAVVNLKKGVLEESVTAPFEMQRAISQPLEADAIRSMLSRVGGTAFSVVAVNMNYPGGLFAPIGAVNQQRRELIKKIEDKICLQSLPAQEQLTKARRRVSEFLAEEDSYCDPSIEDQSRNQKSHAEPLISVYADSLQTSVAAASNGASIVYLQPKIALCSSRNEEANQSLLAIFEDFKRLCPSTQLVWCWPRITKDDYLSAACIVLGSAFKSNLIDGVMVDGCGAAIAASHAAHGIPVSGSHGLNVWNHLSAESLSHLFSRLTLSMELSRVELIDLSRRLGPAGPSLELIVQGNQEVMTAMDDLSSLAGTEEQFYGINDLKRTFPFSVDAARMTHIRNSAETCLIDYIPDLMNIGISSFAVDARSKPEGYGREMAQIYSKAVSLARSGKLQEELPALKERIRSIATGGITSGQFSRGLKDLEDICASKNKA